MTPNPTPPPEDPIRPHVFDGIEEYDKRLPNWWLNTLYAAILFWIGYWGYYEWFRAGPSPQEVVDRSLAEMATARLATAKLDDATLWQMSRNEAFVAAGRATVAANCTACHLASLRGKGENPAAIGPDLTDTTWTHGGRPTEIHDLIAKGVIAKGMPGWGPILGSRKIAEVTAFILSSHEEGEPMVIEQPKPAAP